MDSKEIEKYINKVHCCDCLDFMKKLPDNCVDLVLTDPPYGKKASKGTSGFGSAKNRRYTDNWDNSIPEKKVFDEIFRISKNQIIFGGNYFSNILPASNCWIVWDKKGNIKFKNPFADCELLWTSFNLPIRKYTFKQQGFITDSKDKRQHPTQKPTELLEIILKDFSKENEIVADFFMGSGTTAVSCERLGRRWLGCEISQEYCNIANARIEAERRQLKLPIKINI